MLGVILVSAPPPPLWLWGGCGALALQILGAILVNRPPPPLWLWGGCGALALQILRAILVNRPPPPLWLWGWDAGAREAQGQRRRAPPWR